MLTTSHHLLGFRVFGDGFQKNLLGCFPREWNEVDQSFLWPSFLPFLKIGVSFTFFQSSETSPSRIDLSKIINSGLAVTSASPLSICRCILSGPVGLCTSSLFKCSLAWSSSSSSGKSSLQTFPLISHWPEGQSDQYRLRWRRCSVLQP